MSNTRFERLVAKLRELFQLDQPELDFGIYRILHARSDEITAFLENELLPQVKDALAAYQPADKAALQAELDEAIAQATSLGADPDTLPKVRELRERLENESVDLGTLEAEVYDHLYRFFSRYYHEGDFISLRRYKEGVYAIPYEGEEVKLYWANHDQYYIKTAEYLRDYAFRLRPNDAEDPMRVHFRLVDAAEGEHGNVKEAEGKKRVFVLAADDFIAEEPGEDGRQELVLRFEYRPATVADWPEAVREGKDKPPAQKDLLDAAEKRILAVEDPSLARWISALSEDHTKADRSRADYSRLRAHLNRYTARNTFDYFIHKDLGGFLRRELDFYIKSEVMRLDDIEDESAPRVEQYLSKIKVIRQIALKIIDFLAQLEDFQKKLWLKKKFVIDSNYCVSIGLLPESVWELVLSSESQRAEWADMLGTDDLIGDRTPSEFVDNHPSLVVDTAHFAGHAREVLLEALSPLLQEDQLDGVCIQGDNFHALRLCATRFSRAIQTSYIDPPFNTGDDFAFKDGYRFSSWLALLENRLELGRELLSSSGSQYLHLDHNANACGRLLLDSVFGKSNFVNEIIWRIGWVSGYKTQADAFVRNHDTIFLYAVDKESHFFDKPQARIPYRAFDKDSVREELKSIMDKWGVDSRRIASIKLSFKYPDGRVVKLGLNDNEAGYNIEDTWNCSEYEDLNSNKIKRNAAEYTPHGSEITQKPEQLLRRVIELTTRPRDWVLDYFGGSGTTAAVAWKLNRRFVVVEAERYFDDDLLWRLKWDISGARSVGISKSIPPRQGGFFQYIRLESYEDTLNNLELKRTEMQQSSLDSLEASGIDALKEQYVLRYMLEVESRGSASLLNISQFADPCSYTLRVKPPGSDETRPVAVDLLDTFNWLLGLRVHHIAASQSFTAAFERDQEGRLRLDGHLRVDVGGRWWFRTVEGEAPDGRKVLVIWRNRPGGDDAEGIEQDNLVLNEWFARQGYSAKDSEFDLIYVNGDNNLENLRDIDDRWKVRLIEEEFFHLMFDVEDV